jgi:putative nucleotidyltransferase with HDIG domain
MAKDRDIFNDLYKPILISSLETQREMPFDLYIKRADKFVLFLGKGNTFETSTPERLKNSGHDLVFISRYEQDSYDKYVHELLDKYELESPQKLQAKSKELYDSSKAIMNDIFSKDITRESVESAKGVAETMLLQLQKDKRAFFSIMEVSSYDYYTYTHSINVCMYSVAVGLNLELPPLEMKLLSEGALFHDIGKSKIDINIINKNGKLSDEEFRKIQEHPVLGVKILKENGVEDRTILEIVKEHHEKQNGKGYPRHLRKESINMLAQIVTVADIFDALTTKRSYKKAMSTFEALRLMKSVMKDELNPTILKSFISCFKQG